MFVYTIAIIVLGIMMLTIGVYRFDCLGLIKDVHYKKSEKLKWYNSFILLLFILYIMLEWFTSINEEIQVLFLAILFILESISWWINLRNHQRFINRK